MMFAIYHGILKIRNRIQYQFKASDYTTAATTTASTRILSTLGFEITRRMIEKFNNYNTHNANQYHG